jgi:hypothetical protein
MTARLTPEQRAADRAALERPVPTRLPDYAIVDDVVKLWLDEWARNRATAIAALDALDAADFAIDSLSTRLLASDAELARLRSALARVPHLESRAGDVLAARIAALEAALRKEQERVHLGACDGTVTWLDAAGNREQCSPACREMRAVLDGAA